MEKEISLAQNQNVCCPACGSYDAEQMHVVFGPENTLLCIRRTCDSCEQVYDADFTCDRVLAYDGPDDIAPEKRYYPLHKLSDLTHTAQIVLSEFRSDNHDMNDICYYRNMLCRTVGILRGFLDLM